MKRTIRTPWALGLVVAAAALALAGCGNPGMSGTGTQPTTEPPASEQSTSAPAAASGPSSSPAAAAPAEIQIKGFKYLGTETVSPGTEITVTNEDIEAHTITADTGTAFHANIQVGTSTFTAPAGPGTYPYHCNFHGNMRGTLTVK